MTPRTDRRIELIDVADLPGPTPGIRSGEAHRRQQRHEPRRRLHLAARSFLAVAVLAAVWSLPTPVQGSAQQLDNALIATDSSPPALRFADAEHSLLPLARVWRNQHPYLLDSDYEATHSTEYFSELDAVGRDGGSVAVVYSVVESPDTPENIICHDPSYVPVSARACYPTKIGVGPEYGEMYLYLDKPHEGSVRFRFQHNISSFQPQRVTVTAADATSSLKIYDEIVVAQSDQVPDCGDFPDMDVDAFVCQNLYELLPDPPATTSAMRESLPSLVKPRGEYDLVMAEEFNGVAEDRIGCDNGFATLDSDLWNTRNSDSCAFTDSAGTPCSNVENGAYRLSMSATCNAELSSSGKVHYKYGYIEIKYTYTELSRDSSYMNYAFVVGDTRNALQSLHQRYDVPLEDWEDHGKYVEPELDIVEFTPRYNNFKAHLYGNQREVVKSLDTRPIRGDMRVEFCGSGSNSRALRFPAVGCGSTPIVITQGLEWTPQGYRTFLKVEGVHDSLVRYDLDKFGLEKKSASVDSNGNVTFGRNQRLSGAAFAQHFPNLVEGDDTSFMEQIAVAHLPLFLETVAWGFNPKPSEIKATIEYDYIRIFQPSNKYADMEPVYK